jgi:hypothetical protein
MFENLNLIGHRAGVSFAQGDRKSVSGHFRHAAQQDQPTLHLLADSSTKTNFEMRQILCGAYR